ncbi:MAG: cytochrome c oxidase subunit 3 [Pseudomonadota bacterium]
MNTSAHGQQAYYIPDPSPWPVIAMLSIFSIMVGTALAINGVGIGRWVMVAGFLLLITMFYGWFGTVISESLSDCYNAQVDRTFRQAMAWFISSEVFFFLCFFGALFYLRNIAMPWLGGEGYLAATHDLYNQFVAQWPSAGPKGEAFTPMGAWGIPAINTLILLSSGVTVTVAHWGLKEGNRQKLIWGLVATVTLGLLFVVLQAVEYRHAYHELNLTLKSGVYGSTFFMLTGFHGFHVTLGSIMLIAILGRAIRGHFSPHNHFAFEAVAWYWHFVDVVWLGLFIFVYWM